MRLCAILEHEDALAVCELHEARHIGGAPVEMNDDDRLRAVRDQRGYCGRRDRFRIDVDVREDRLRTNQVNARRRGDETSRRYDYLVAGSDAVGAQDSFEGQ